MKSLKKILAALIAVILTATILLWILAKSVKPEVIKNYVSSQLSELTHQNSKVEGDISWQVFPRPGIKITKIQIGDASSPQNYSVKLENLLFNLKITPLLSGKLVFSELKVDGFKITINPAALPKVIINEQEEEEPQDKDVKNNLTEQFAIERFLLSRGQISIIENKQTISLSGLQIGGEQFNLQKMVFPLQFKSNIELSEDSHTILKAYANFKGSISLSPSVFSNPITVLQNTPLDGVISFQNVKIKQFKIAKISAHAKTKPGVLFLNPLTFNLYNGESVGDLNYEFASKKLTINQTATNLDSSKFISDSLNKSLVKGSLDLSLHAQANLQHENWQGSTTGNGSFTIKNGLIESINLDKVVVETGDKISKLFAIETVKKERALELGQFNNPEFFKGGTNFNLLTFQYQLKDGKLESNSLVLQTDKLQLKGEGSLDLNNENLYSNLFAKVTFLEAGLNKIQQLLGGSFPILISGTLSEPRVIPDLQKINPILTRIWLKDSLTKPVKQLGNTLKIILDNGQNLL
ncbi:MAG: AsmA family protein [Tatlockia sp.]|nr:AsmA family protein [Tatlockia sp.]